MQLQDRGGISAWPWKLESCIDDIIRRVGIISSAGHSAFKYVQVLGGGISADWAPDNDVYCEGILQYNNNSISSSNLESNDT